MDYLILVLLAITSFDACRRLLSKGADCASIKVDYELCNPPFLLD